MTSQVPRTQRALRLPPIALLLQTLTRGTCIARLTDGLLRIPLIHPAERRASPCDQRISSGIKLRVLFIGGQIPESTTRCCNFQNERSE
jgi:hypothetical protein